MGRWGHTCHNFAQVVRWLHRVGEVPGGLVEDGVLLDIPAFVSMLSDWNGE